MCPVFDSARGYSGFPLCGGWGGGRILFCNKDELLVMWPFVAKDQLWSSRVVPSLCWYQMLLFSFSFNEGKVHKLNKKYIKKRPTQHRRTWSVRDLNEAYYALVKPECQDRPLKIVLAIPECINQFLWKWGIKVIQFFNQFIKPRPCIVIALFRLFYCVFFRSGFLALGRKCNDVTKIKQSSFIKNTKVLPCYLIC